MRQKFNAKLSYTRCYVPFFLQINNKMDYKDEAQRLINYSMNLLSIQYNSDGVVMKRRECLPMARMIARSHISFLINQGNFAPHIYDYWKKVEEELDMCL